MSRLRLSVLSLLASVVLSLFALQSAYATPQSDADACVQQQLVFNPASGGFLPVNNFNATGQSFMNCFGWQLFIALNWPVNPGWPTTAALAGEPDMNSSLAQFGVPTTAGQPMTVAPVWASYKDANDIFLPGAPVPSGWGVQTLVPSNCSTQGSLKAMSVGARKFMTATSESAINARHGFHLSSGTLATIPDPIMEASGGWLTDQAGQLVFFERKVGKAEFDYIVSKGLYDAANQLKVAQNLDNQNPGGLSLPIGEPMRSLPPTPVPQEQLGALELKAAWRILTGKPELYGRYLTTVAWLKNPATLQCTQQVVGLVGLHIINKTQASPNFIWTTFEQVDNVPEPAQAPAQQTPPDGFAFNNPNCGTGPECTPNVARIQCQQHHPDRDCTEPYPRDQPVQTTREHPLPTELQALNGAVQANFAQQSQGKSVFQYYKLINVLWTLTPNPPVQPEPGVSAAVPLSYGPFISQGNVPVANTTLETYVQGDNCNACHQYATIAGSSTLASDFSFLFNSADSASKKSLVKRVKAFETLKDQP
ncbi:hypothetical protein HX836_31305 [Pseudomonas yamanorum]|uniref:Cytochrome c family protein n=1 Tax=Pseudomonas yamanorum TaxID=515393 RepID=A0A7Y8FGJ6_9PSED|nr:hypothetical protein [Pseudomonas yamanorum]NVZ86320.1 hypothetical protein [Pseudomonas yamanorum]NWE78740.1 hypothetical protein [Pseudomonas yamanorum]